MKTERTFTACTVTPKQEKRIRGGHPWVYEDEITEISAEPENGSIVDVFGRKHNYLGSGLYSANSKIRIRILDHNANEKFDDAFFARRTAYALKYRREVMGEDFANCRLIHGEADGLPGLTIDKYGDILVTEVSSYGIDLRRDVIYRALVSGLQEYGVTVSGIYERNDGDLRRREGLAQYTGWYEALSPEPKDKVIINEHGILYEVDILNGQKTGFFLDQKYNRLEIRKIAGNMDVLDCCTHTGSFALNAAYGGAASVTALDISDTALDTARTNAVLNHLEDRVEFRQGDVFEELKSYLQEHRKFDVIILDPPAFTKSRSTLRNAYNGYLRLNTYGMRLVKRGGYLATCSCSHFMDTETFRQMLKEASEAAGVTLRIITETHAACDHPRLISVPETDYLKFFLLQII